ncbi:phosphoenolpyruvate--protein phosphotransferase [Marinobacterium aestuariivivens]|uniref:Phosphoenolpyruvate-protein phosphotransferase n=1 Tax=Marinobacterium aestuariivivens TaxID=1698799 RepID=A0ABW1ZVP1_9GAMM
MRSLTGVPISPGYAEGIAVILDLAQTSDIPQYSIDFNEVDREIARFHDALERSCDELGQLEQRVLDELGHTQSSIFSAHLALLRDRQFSDKVKQRISDDLVNVEQALDGEISDLARLLASVENEYMRERALDLRDVGKRVLRQLAHEDSPRLAALPSGSVIVARELLPSEAIDLDRRHLAGIVTEAGGVNSHAAILARALGIPAVTAVTDACTLIESGSRLLVDGVAGQVTLMPSTGALKDFSGRKQRYERHAATEASAEQLDCVTLDGTPIKLLANINRQDEAALVARHYLHGVGLFRTECLYLDAPTPPESDRQLEVYRQLVAALEGRSLVIRTLDLGGDKLPAFISRRRESNPNLGLRGLRFSLAEPELFSAQLQAIARVAGSGDVSVLFPMVLGPSDLRQGIELLRRESEAAGLDRLPPVGAMIETPSALFALPEILALVDFISIGTNDLTQLMLAADRNATELLETSSVLHPSVLRAIRQVVRACDEADREICVCGEAAGEAAIASLLVGLGVRRLSMSPVRSASVRYRLRRHRLSDLEDLAERSLAADSAEQVAQLLDALRPGA